MTRIATIWHKSQFTGKNGRLRRNGGICK